MTKQFREQILKQMAEKKKARAADDTKSVSKKDMSIAFEDITVPCLLVLVEKGRMGDTFSKSFRGMDLRLRNQSSLAVVVQELGRLAGWRPKNCTVPPLPKWLVKKLHVSYCIAGDEVPVWLQREGDVSTLDDEWGYGGGTNPVLPVAIVSSTLYKKIEEAVDSGSACEALVRFQHLQQIKKPQLRERDPDISPGAISIITKQAKQ